MSVRVLFTRASAASEQWQPFDSVMPLPVLPPPVLQGPLAPPLLPVVPPVPFFTGALDPPQRRQVPICASCHARIHTQACDGRM